MQYYNPHFFIYDYRLYKYYISRTVRRTKKFVAADAAVPLGVQFTPAECKLHSCRNVILVELLFETSLRFYAM